MTPKLYKKDFKMIADEIAALPKSHRHSACNLILKVGRRFNCNFDGDRFVEACNLDEE